jgi:hypothetical protein
MLLLVMLIMSIYGAYASSEYKNVKLRSHCGHTACVKLVHKLTQRPQPLPMKAPMTPPNLAPATGAASVRFDPMPAPARPVSGQTASGLDRLWWVALIAVSVALVFPMLLTDVPPLLDYPNHLARLMVLADNGADPILASFYKPSWGIIPDLGIDALGTPLMWILPVHVAGRVILSVVLLLPVLGAVAYSRALFGRATWWSLGAALVAYNACYMQGFLNFIAGTGLALLLAASWLRGRDTHPARTLAIAMAGAVVLFFCHLMGLLFYALLIGSAELARLPIWLRDPRRLVLRVAYAASIFVVPAALYLSSELNAMAEETVFLPVDKKFAQLLEPFASYSLSLDIATAVLLTGGLVLAAAAGRLRIPARSAVALGLVALIYVAAPSEYKGTYNLDMRFVVYGGYLMFCGVAPAGFRPRTAKLLMAGVAALFLVRMAILSDVWAGHNQDLAQLRAVLAHVQPGSRVFVTDVKPEENPEYWENADRARWLSNGLRMDPHWAALVLIERQAWWPYLFANASQQPIRNRKVYQDLADSIVHLPPHRELEVPGHVGLCGFDTVLLMIAGGEPDLEHYATDRLSLIEGNDTAALYRIRQNPDCPQVKR